MPWIFLRSSWHGQRESKNHIICLRRLLGRSFKKPIAAAEVAWHNRWQLRFRPRSGMASCESGRSPPSRPLPEHSVSRLLNPGPHPMAAEMSRCPPERRPRVWTNHGPDVGQAWVKMDQMKPRCEQTVDQTQATE